MNNLIIFISIILIVSCSHNNSSNIQQEYDCVKNSGILFNLDSLSFYDKCVEIINLNDDTIYEISPQIYKLQKLNSIELTNCHFNNLSTLFINLSKSKSLKRLNIDFKKRTIIPKEIGLLQNIEELIITIDSTTTLPNEFYKLKGLKMLNIYANYYKEDKRFINFMNLKCFGLTANLKQIPSFVFKLKKLEVLDISYNPIKVIPDKISQLHSLKELNIIHTPFILEAGNDKDIELLTKLKKTCHGCKIISNIVSFE